MLNDGRMNATNTHTGSATSLPKCEHEGCTCTVEDDQRFCSDYCHEHDGMEHAAGEQCKCGHPECEHVMAAPGVLIAPLP